MGKHLAGRDADAAGQFDGLALGNGPCLAERPARRLDRLIEPERRLGRFQPLERAVEKRQPERLFQRLDMASEGRLRQTEPAGRLRQRAFGNHRLETAPQGPVRFGGCGISIHL